MRVWKKTLSPSFSAVIRYPTVMGFYLTDSASRSQYSTVVSLSVRLTTAYLNQTQVDLTHVQHVSTTIKPLRRNLLTGLTLHCRS